MWKSNYCETVWLTSRQARPEEMEWGLSTCEELVGGWPMHLHSAACLAYFFVFCDDIVLCTVPQKGCQSRLPTTRAAAALLPSCADTALVILWTILLQRLQRHRSAPGQRSSLRLLAPRRWAMG